MPRKALLIGDTILNTTYYARPMADDEWQVPFAFLNEELLEIEREHPDRPHHSVQGIGYVARALHTAGRGRPLACTGLGGLPESMRRVVTEAAHCVELSAPAPVVVRILRNVAFSHITSNTAAAYRPQLRLDAPRDVSASVDEELAGLVGQLAPGDLCLIRTSTPEFLAGRAEGGDSHADRVHRTGARVNALQRSLQTAGAVVAIDLRPISPNLEILDSSTIVSTTFSRLREWATGRRLVRSGGGVLAEIEQYFWALAPRALFCFAPDLEGRPSTVLMVRASDHPARAGRWVFPLPFAYPDGGGAGMVIGGDAFVAGYLGEMLAADSIGDEVLVRGAARATDALASVLPKPLGSTFEPNSGSREAVSVETCVRTTKFDLFKHAHLQGIPPREPYLGDLNVIAPPGGDLRKVLEKLRQDLERWAPRPGSDLIAIFGESRCGKEYPLEQLLQAQQRMMVGPVNMYQFLQETPKVVSYLRNRGAMFEGAASLGRYRSVLVIDEVVPDDAGRSLLNLTAEKVCRNFEAEVDKAKSRDDPRNFSEFLVIILSSIPRERLLPDLHGRLCADIFVPPLRDRVEEIPYVIPNNLDSGMGRWEAPSELRMSYLALSALLGHDFRRAHGVAQGMGLDQQNFRALQDILAYACRNALGREPSHPAIRLGDLPEALHRLAYRGEPDDAGLLYSKPGRAAQIPGRW